MQLKSLVLVLVGGAILVGCPSAHPEGPMGKWAIALNMHNGPPENPTVAVFVRCTPRMPEVALEIRPDHTLYWHLPQNLAAIWTAKGARLTYRIQTVDGLPLSALAKHMPLTSKSAQRLGMPFGLELMKDGRMRGQIPSFVSPLRLSPKKHGGQPRKTTGS